MNPKQPMSLGVKKADARIDWKKPGREVYNLIRGCNPQPGAWAEFMGDEFTFVDT